MKNIIICSLVGTGKTTIAKKIGNHLISKLSKLKTEDIS